MVIEGQGSGQCQTDETLIYMGQEVAFLAPSMSRRYLGVWVTPTGDMSATKTRIFKKTEEARDLLRHHPLTPEQAIDLYEHWSGSVRILGGVGPMDGKRAREA